MEHHFDIELNSLTQKLLAMAGYAEAAVHDAMRALADRDYNLALEIKANDRVLDQFEIEIDDLAIHLLAKAPLASDLRLVTVAMKISQNLERVGDEAVKIAKRARDLSQEPPVKVIIDLPRMAQLAVHMLKSALDSFVHRDSAAARKIIPLDKQVDAANKEINRTLAKYMGENSASIGRCLNLIIISKSLERIADHATNVAEEVVYLCEALDIRHAEKVQSVAGP
jgi:phosphate transport system protein